MGGFVTSEVLDWVVKWWYITLRGRKVGHESLLSVRDNHTFFPPTCTHKLSILTL